MFKTFYVCVCSLSVHFLIILLLFAFFVQGDYKTKDEKTPEELEAYNMKQKLVMRKRAAAAKKKKAKEEAEAAAKAAAAKRKRESEPPCKIYNCSLAFHCRCIICFL